MEQLSDIHKDNDSLIHDWDDECCICASLKCMMNCNCKLKSGKSHGNIGLIADYFIHAGSALFVCISLLFSGLLVYYCMHVC